MIHSLSAIQGYVAIGSLIGDSNPLGDHYRFNDSSDISLATDYVFNDAILADDATNYLFNGET